MLFNSTIFYVFFAFILALYYGPFTWRTRKVILLTASYVFYGTWNPPFVLLLMLSTMVDWWLGRLIHRESRVGRRRALACVSIAVNMGALGYFKYGEFLLENFLTLTRLAGVDWQVASPNIILPAGISFYVFESLSYTLDVYRRRVEPCDSLLDFSLFLAFFPHLVAGPIVRPNDLIPQFREPKRATREQFVWGLLLFFLGVFQKAVFADGLLAPSSDRVFAQTGLVSTADAWLGVLAFSGQIFFDFAGYSTAAVGCALCFGIDLPRNFRYPYAALGFSDLWRRWHISLSEWFRDYVYRPLGGDRHGTARTVLSVMTTMTLAGLWHGANWTFVAWGAVHGCYLLGERIVERPLSRAARLLSPRVRVAAGVLLTYALVMLALVFFRARTFETASHLLASMLGIAGNGTTTLTSLAALEVVLLTVGMLAWHATMRDRSLADVAARLSAPTLGLVAAAMVFILFLTQGTGDAFIYFKF